MKAKQNQQQKTNEELKYTMKMNINGKVLCDSFPIGRWEQMPTYPRYPGRHRQTKELSPPKSSLVNPRSLLDN